MLRQLVQKPISSIEEHEESNRIAEEAFWNRKRCFEEVRRLWEERQLPKKLLKERSSFTNTTKMNRDYMNC